LECQNGDYVAAYVDGEFTLKQFKLDEANNCAWLIPANEKYDSIKVTEDNQFLIWGVITSVIKRFHKF
jgi:DNA polymerase V